MRLTTALVAFSVLSVGAGASPGHAAASERPLPARFLAMGGAGIALARGMHEAGLNPAAIAMRDGLTASFTGSNLSASRRERLLSAGASLGHLGAGLDWSRLSMAIRAFDQEGDEAGRDTWHDDAVRLTLGAELMGLLANGGTAAGARRLEVAAGVAGSWLRNSVEQSMSEHDVVLDLGFLVAYAQREDGAGSQGRAHDDVEGRSPGLASAAPPDRWRLSFGGCTRAVLTPHLEGRASSPARVGLGLGVEVVPAFEQSGLPQLPASFGDPLRIAVAWDASRFVGKEVTYESKATRISSGVEMSLLGVLSLRGGGAFESRREPFWSYGLGLGFLSDGTGIRADWARTQTWPWLRAWENRFSVEASIGWALLAM